VPAQADALRLGHLTPRSGFLGVVGDQGFRGATLAVEETNAAGGVLGRKLELVAEDTATPGTAAAKAQKLVERDKAICLIGEVSSSSALAIAEQALRAGVPFFNTGANADALRGQSCNRCTFHVEGSNTMYAKTIGTWQRQQNLVKGARWYFVTADYPFGQDLFRVAARFLQENGGVILADDRVSTTTTDYAPYLLKIRSLRPDCVYLCLAGTDQMTFVRQYREAGLPFLLTGGVMDTALFWAAGVDSIAGVWQSLWYHGLKLPAAQAFTERFTERWKLPPDNQAWGDYLAVRIFAQSVSETRKTALASLVEHLEKGAAFDLLKERKGLFRATDHQLLQEMYVVRAKDRAQSKDVWDVFDVVDTLPRAAERLESIQPTWAENACRMG
jgi:branched-chain amino acid transport system substrate-binding protein